MTFLAAPDAAPALLSGSPSLHLPTKERRSVSVADAQIVQLPKIHDPRGNLTFIEGGVHIPFDVKRVYYLYDVPGGADRGAHAHRKLHQFIIAMSGSFDFVLDDGFETRRIQLNRSYFGLYVPPMTWRNLENFSTGAVCMSLVSEKYDEADYIRDYDEYLRAVRGAAA